MRLIRRGIWLSLVALTSGLALAVPAGAHMLGQVVERRSGVGNVSGEAGAGSRTDSMIVTPSAEGLIPTAQATTSTWWAGDRRLTQAYGCTASRFELRAPRSKAICPAARPRFHTGVDFGFGGACGALIRTPVRVRVMAVGGFDRFGNRYSGGVQGTATRGFGPFYPTLRLPGGKDLILAHVGSAGVRAGDVLAPGRVVAKVGSFGNSTGCHVHFEVRRGGGGFLTDINPMPYLRLS